jgi:hypothetical protein
MPASATVMFRDYEPGNAKGAASSPAWGNAPRIYEMKKVNSAESAIRFRHQLDRHWRHAPIVQ